MQKTRRPQRRTIQACATAQLDETPLMWSPATTDLAVSTHIGIPTSCSVFYITTSRYTRACQITLLGSYCCLPVSVFTSRYQPTSQAYRILSRTLKCHNTSNAFVGGKSAATVSSTRILVSARQPESLLRRWNSLGLLLLSSCQTNIRCLFRRQCGMSWDCSVRAVFHTDTLSYPALANS